MAERDLAAGRLLKELRENRGVSPEQLPYELLKAGLHPVSGPTIRRIERLGVIPHVRARFALAQFHDREVSEIWRVKRRAKVAA